MQGFRIFEKKNGNKEFRCQFGKPDAVENQPIFSDPGRHQKHPLQGDPDHFTEPQIRRAQVQVRGLPHHQRTGRAGRTQTGRKRQSEQALPGCDRPDRVSLGPSRVPPKPGIGRQEGALSVESDQADDPVQNVCQQLAGAIAKSVRQEAGRRKQSFQNYSHQQRY